MSPTANRQAATPGAFGTSQVARIIGVPPRRVRSWARGGLCRAVRRGRYFQFSFQDLVLLRTARSLLQQQVPAQRVRRALRELARRLPPDCPPSALRISVEGRDVVVRNGRVAWQPESGQTVFLFDVEDLARRSGTVVSAARTRGSAAKAAREDESCAATWFERALAIEDDDLQQACAWYRRALHLDPEFADAYVNLGRLVHDAGDVATAVGLYREALKRAPDDAVAHYNLGLALEDTRKYTVAVQHYREAIRVEPGFADAHFNLARLLEKLGRKSEASWHLLVYSRLTSVT